MSEQSIALNNASAGHGDDWGMKFPTRSLGQVDNLSTAADHGRLVKANTPVEYRSHNLTVYYSKHSMRNAHLVTSGDWNV